MNNAPLFLRRATLALLCGLGLWVTLPAFAAPPVPTEFRLHNRGQDRIFDVSLSEIWVTVGEQRRELHKIAPLASPQEALAAAEQARFANGRPAGLVLRERGGPDSEFSRALLTRDVLARIAPPADPQALATVLGATAATPLPQGDGWWLFVAGDLAGAPALAAALRAQPGVLYAEAQLARKFQQRFVPDDPFIPVLWHLINTGQEGGTPGVDVAVTNVWERYRGNGIVIGIIDGGMQTDHPDLSTNVVTGLGYDYIDGDPDPNPNGPDDNHGTCVAGVAAASGNNNLGVTGAGYNSGLVGLRLIGGFTTDADAASAFLYENQVIGIKNNSWGPALDYIFLGGPSPVEQTALRQSVVSGRGGRGVIYTWASGNSRREFGNANFDGYSNSRYTIAVTGTDDRGGIVSYATPGSCVAVAAPTGDSGSGRQDITTTDRTSTNGYNPSPGTIDYVNEDYTRTFDGTSSACPLASGVIALILEANPNLGWRDVQEIVMRSARVISPENPEWQTNAAGFHFNYNFGAGMIQADAGVELARNWTNLKPETNVVHEISSLGLVIPDDDLVGVSYDFFVTEPNLRVEHVTLEVNISHPRRGDLVIDLVSPSGMVSRLATPRPYDPFSDLQWTFMTVFNWGEDAVGRWTIRFRDLERRDSGLVNDLKLTIYGVEQEAAPDPTTSDLSVRMVGAPDPVLVGNTLTYSVTLTNTGLNTASNVVVSQNLPLSTVFLSGNSPYGPVTHVAGLVTWSPTNIPPFTSASMTVRVLAAVPGTVFSSVSVTNTSPDSNPANNNFVVSTRVLPLTADLGLSLTDSPDPALVGGALTYQLMVTNRGPSIAAGTVVTATLPATVAITGMNASQGVTTVNSNIVTFSLGAMNSGGAASMTVTCRPLSPGNLLATAKVASNLPDPVGGNNTASASTAVNPAVDLAVALTDLPDPAVLYSNYYYFVSVTNHGPNPATGVTLNQTIPAGIRVVSNFVSQGSAAIVPGGGTVIASLGNLGVGASAQLIVTAAGTNVGTFTSTVTASAAQADASLGNNSATVTTEVALPFVSIVAAGATLLSEQPPANGGIEIGETVSIEFRLRNAGNVPNTNLSATLLTGGGVTQVTGNPQSYGLLTPGGLPVGKPFGFTAAGTNGGTITARLQLTDNGVIIGTNFFTFSLPRLTNPANPVPIVINDHTTASPYPSTINVAGLTGIVGKVTVTLSNLNHTYPDDMQVLLVGPGNLKVLLMADAGGGSAFNGTTITFDDAAPPMGDGGNVGAGSYRPSSYGSVGSLPAPAPAAPYNTNLAVFNGIAPNGAWSLYVADIAIGDAGTIANGWSLGLSTGTPVNQIADLRLAANAAPNPVQVGSPLTFTYTITNAGPNTANGVVLSNLQPDSVRILSAVAEGGVCTTNGNLLTCVIPTLPAGAKAAVTVVVRPLTPGTIAASALVTGAEVDLNSANNQATAAATAQLPVADLVLGLLPPASTTVVLGSNVTYTLTATNLGPQNALNVTVTDLLGALTTNDFTIVGLTNSSGTALDYSNSVVVADWGDLLPGAGGELTITLQANALGTFTNSIVAAHGSSDPVTTNSQAQFVLQVVPPMPKIMAAGATMLAENQPPPNSTVNPGETVTVALALQNLGELTASNLVATLVAGGGVQNPSGAQPYGELAPGAASVARPFTFTAVGAGPYTATLMLTNDTLSLGSVSFTFHPPAAATAANPNPIQIPELGTANPYPSLLPVSGLTGVISQVTVTLSNLTHSFPSDLDILLVSPDGTSIVLLSDAGGNYAITNVALTFSNAAPATLPASARIVSGTYRPTDYAPDDLFVAPAPPAPRAADLAAFNGQNPNGTWRLFIMDDAAGDHGRLDGWRLNFTIVQPLNPPADLSVTLGAEPPSMTSWQNFTVRSTVANAGPEAAPLVLLTNQLPAGLKLISASAPYGVVWTNTPAGVVFALGQLDPGAEVETTMVVQPLAGGNQTVLATVAGPLSTDLNLPNNIGSVVVTTIAPPPAPRLVASLVNGTFTLTVVGQPNTSYDLQSNSALPGTWSPVTTLTTDAQGHATWSPASTQLSPYFYRTVQHP
jgi:uncharacterized repeat protein (TIGR01451 family)